MDEKERREAAARAMAVYDAEFPEAAAARRKRLMGFTGIGLFAALLCAAAIIAGSLGLFGTSLSLAGPQGTGMAADAKDLNFAAVYLGSLPWDRKEHDSVKPLEKMKNIRSALRFFSRFPPAEIAAMKAADSSMDNAAANYETLAGTLVGFTARALSVEPLEQSISPDAGGPSEFVTLEAGEGCGSASLLVVGRLPEGAGEGDTLRVKCIPIYLYRPEEEPSRPDIFFITIPALVEKAS